MKPPPQNLEVEQALLGMLIGDPARMDHPRVANLTPNDFFRDIHGRTFALLAELRAAGRSIDGLAVEDALVAAKAFPGVAEAFGYVSTLLESAPPWDDAEQYAAVVGEKSLKRRLILAAEETLRDTYDDADTAAGIIGRAEERVFAIGDSEAKAAVCTAADAADEVLARLDRREAGECFGVPCGLFDLHAKLGPLMPGWLVILAARPSIGKTALGLRVAEFASLDVDPPRTTLLCSLEMDRQELAARLLTGRAGVPGNRLQEGKRPDAAERRRLDARARELRDSGRLHIDDRPVMTVAQIAAAARRIKAQHGLGLLVIDYVQLLQPSARSNQKASRQEQVAGISRDLKGLAKDLGVPILALSQLNRESEKRADRRPCLADLRESGAIEQDADVVLLLHRPDFYDKADRPGEADIIVAKNRHGETGTVRLSWLAPLGRFENFCHAVAVAEPVVHRNYDPPY